MDRLSQLLGDAIEILHAREQRYAVGHVIPSAVVHCSRLVLLAEGELNYEVEGRSVPLRGPVMLLVPAWARRQWRSTSSDGAHLLFCEFYRLGEDAALQSAAFDLEEELAAMRRVIRFAASNEPDHRLVAVAELKATLGRFRLTAGPLLPVDASLTASARPTSTQPLVEQAVALLANHLHEPDPLALVSRQIPITGGYLRRLFKVHLGLSPRQYLQLQRMRRARFLLHEQNQLVKEVAAAVGYADPFRFSKRYKEFWGVSPSDDRP